MRIRRSPVEDEITLDGETVVLVGDQAVALSRPASVGLRLLDTEAWVDVDAWFAAVEAELGPAPEGPSARTALVDGLREAGLILVQDGDGDG